MKRTLLSSLAVLAILLVGLSLTGCNGHSEHGSSNQKPAEHQHSH